MTPDPESPAARAFRRHGVTLALALACAGMTVLLVRSELCPESSSAHRMPPALVLARFLRGESQSALGLWWKGERVGSCLLRVFPGSLTRLHGVLEGSVPVLGRRHAGKVELDCSLRRARELEALRVRGRVEDVSVDVQADAARNLVRWRVAGGGMNEEREMPLRELAEGGVAGLQKRLGELPQEWRTPAAGQLAAGARAWKLFAASTRLSRRGVSVDAYVLEARLDANWWARLWVSPTGELLKLESSFGLRALNEDYFQM
jgi:hypothetical protein